MDGIIELTIAQTALAYVFVLIVIVLFRVRGIRREKETLLACIRMTLQLILAGLALVYVLERPSPFLTVLVIMVMEAFAIYTVLRRYRRSLSRRLILVISFSMLAGTLVCLLYFLLVVVRISPWYDPRYFIPIAGMVIGNSMTGVALGVKSLTEGMLRERKLVEEALILGATPQAASKEIVNRSFDTAILPTINSMLGMGIVFLPGMMTGQILSGVSPVTAIAYQIAIMLGILGSVGLTVILMLQMGYKTFFNRQDQLV